MRNSTCFLFCLPLVGECFRFHLSVFLDDSSSRIYVYHTILDRANISNNRNNAKCLYIDFKNNIIFLQFYRLYYTSKRKTRYRFFGIFKIYFLFKVHVYNLKIQSLELHMFRGKIACQHSLKTLFILYRPVNTILILLSFYAYTIYPLILTQDDFSNTCTDLD